MYIVGHRNYELTDMILKQIALLPLFVVVQYAFAQDFSRGSAFKWSEKTRDWHIGLTTSTTRYCGDLSERYALDHLQLSWSAELHVRYRLVEQLSLRTDIGLYRLIADQKYTRNGDNHLSFSSTNPTVLVGLQYDLLNVVDKYKKSTYVWIGIGLTRLNPTTTYQAIVYDLPTLRTENTDYPRIIGQFAYGFGYPFILNNQIQLRVEAHYTHVFSDYLDDVRSLYSNKTGRPAIEQQLADRRAEFGLTPNTVGTQRGNPLRNDGYFMFSLQLVRKLNTL